MAEIKIFWSDRARTDLEEIIEYIAQDSPVAARNFASKIIAATSALETFPSIGRIVPEFGKADMREILYRNYRIVYQLSEDMAKIVTIFHGSRLFT